MRLLSIATDPNAGGSSKSLLNLLAGLKDLGHDILVIIPKEGYLSENLKKNNIHYLVLPITRIAIWPRVTTISDILYYIPRFVYSILCKYINRQKLNTIVRNYKPDIIHSNVSLVTDGYAIASKEGIPHLWHIREYGDKDFKLHVFPSKRRHISSLKQSYSIAITNGIKEYNGLSEKCKVIYNGVRKQSFNPDVIDKEDCFLFVGHVNENKGVTDLIKAYIHYKKLGGKKNLRIVGFYEEVYHKKLLSLLIQNNIEHSVEFLGQQSDIDSLMQRSKALIVPSKYEAFGRITAEAMFNKCLVIGRNTAGTKEQIELGNKECGKKIALLFNNIDELTKAMMTVDNLEGLEYKEMLELAQKFAISNFSTEKNIELTESFMKEILAST